MILIVALPLDNNKGRLAGYYFTHAGVTPFVALLSLISSNVAGHTKKTTVAAMYLIGKPHLPNSILIYLLANCTEDIVLAI